MRVGFTSNFTEKIRPNMAYISLDLATKVLLKQYLLTHFPQRPGSAFEFWGPVSPAIDPTDKVALTSSPPVVRITTQKNRKG